MTRTIVDEAGVQAMLRRMIAEIAECHAAGSAASPPVVVLGIQLGGVRLAQRLAQGLSQLWQQEVPHGSLDVAMHRDDLGHRGAAPLRATEVPVDVTGRTVLLTDDVISTGRTTRAALDALHDLGRPTRVQLAVMVDRGGRELPIMPDFVGMEVAVPAHERISVRYAEDGGRDQIDVVTGPGRPEAPDPQR